MKGSDVEGRVETEPLALGDGIRIGDLAVGPVGRPGEDGLASVRDGDTECVVDMSTAQLGHGDLTAKQGKSSRGCAIRVRKDPGVVRGSRQVAPPTGLPAAGGV